MVLSVFLVENSIIFLIFHIYFFSIECGDIFFFRIRKLNGYSLCVENNTNQNEIQKEIILYFRLIGRTGMVNDTTMKFMDIILKLTTVSNMDWSRLWNIHSCMIHMTSFPWLIMVTLKLKQKEVIMDVNSYLIFVVIKCRFQFELIFVEIFVPLNYPDIHSY